MAGILYVVATPIGNLEDVTLRALRVLRDVSLVAAEDTRRTARLLQHYSISTPTTSLHEHNEREKTSKLIDRLRAGNSVALVSDAGTPVVSDPGETLIAAKNLPVSGGSPEQQAALAHELADLWFHTLVLLAAYDLPLSVLTDELARRMGRSGLEEKAARPNN